MVEWSITTVLKTVVPRGTGGSNPSLSANKGVNQRVTRFTPFITPKNYDTLRKLIATKTALALVKLPHQQIFCVLIKGLIYIN